MASASGSGNAPLNTHSYTRAPRYQAAADQFQRAIDVFEAIDDQSEANRDL